MQISVTEILGFVTGASCVWLLAKQNIWNWPIAIANNIFYIVVFVRSGLYGDAGLQVVYIVLGIYGWITWHRKGSDAPLVVRRTSMAVWAWLGPAMLVAAVLLAQVLQRFTDSTVPAVDAVTTSLALGATLGQCNKLLESWWIWIAADLIYIPLYIYKGLWLTSGLYFVFLMLCVGGLREWRRALEPA